MNTETAGTAWGFDPAHLSVERAIAEFRSGRPVILRGDAQTLLVLGVEDLDDAAASALADAGAEARLILPSARLRRLGVERQQPGCIALPVMDRARVERLALQIDARIDAPVRQASDTEALALELAALSLVMPAVLSVTLGDDGPAGVLETTAEALRGYRLGMARSMRIVSRAPVPLDGAPDTEFVVFRGGEGLRDQVAVIIGQPDLAQPVFVRLHSACLTGDLFGSLKCDCGDQLRGTAKFMAENGGGVLLYLDQEGRGNGIANKIRAYKLQSQGWDTYDADEVLGFGPDQRGFDFAAEMLRQLGVQRVAVMTNNPQKIAALERAGITVVSDRRVLGRATAENVLYLASKRDRAGHFIDLDALAALKPVQD